MDTRTNAQIAAQVAIEAVANDPNAYNEATIAAVIAAAEASGVSEFFLKMVWSATEILDEYEPEDRGAYLRPEEAWS